MEIKKIPNNFEKSNIVIKQGDKELIILFAGNLDLYMGLSNGQNIGNENISMNFDITKEDYELYTIFDDLYKQIINGQPFGNSNSEIDYRNLFQYNDLVDEKGNITWVSDEGPGDAEDRMIMSKVDDDTYRLNFVRNDLEPEYFFKNNQGICVRFRNSGSRYEPYNAAFMNLYRDLQNIDDNYHQIHIEELVYIKKMKKGA